MTPWIIVIFIGGYLAIALEHPIRINKAAAALFTGIVCWTLFVLSVPAKESAIEQMLHHLGEISSILFFLLGAMTIVEIIDSHDGFAVITDSIKTKSMTKLLWMVSFLTFFLSAILDNLTTAIVMTSLTRKILNNRSDRLWFTGMIVIAANAGGAFSPLGDVTTTMLWIGGQITAQNVILKLFLPSIAVCIVPLLIITLRYRKKFIEQKVIGDKSEINTTEARFILITGIILFLCVPVFKIVTHLPPFAGMLLSLSLLWIMVSLIHLGKPHELKDKYTVTRALQKIDSPSILFFLGILLAVAALDVSGILHELATVINRVSNNIYQTGIALGIISAIIDNVPLVAAAQGMYDLNVYPPDHDFWEFLALATGTGGSAIIIGSAAGVAAMGIEKIDFFWYLKNISWIALAGFAAGVLIYIVQTLV